MNQLRLGYLNNVLLIGRLVADPELRYTQKGAPVCDFRIACSRRYKNRESGEWQEETLRKENNDGKIIIPEVKIYGKTFSKEFTDVEVTAHNLRDDVFQQGVITAIDVILSLADQGELTYELNWYDSIGQASVVRSYWVDTIDNDTAEGYCGFVYESGSNNYIGVDGNHIHLPSDTRILNSPEYLAYFWICLNPHGGVTVPTIPTVNE